MLSYKHQYNMEDFNVMVFKKILNKMEDGIGAF